MPGKVDPVPLAVPLPDFKKDCYPPYFNGVESPFGIPHFPTLATATAKVISVLDSPVWRRPVVTTFGCKKSLKNPTITSFGEETPL